MAPQRRYLKPPITEAIVAFRFEQAMSEERVARFRKSLLSRFPKQTDVLRRQFTLNTEAGQVQESVVEKSCRLANDEDNRIVLLSPDQLAISHLAPYESWDFLRADAQELWKLNRKIAGVRKLTRYGVRYINRLDLKYDEDGAVDYKRYLNLKIDFPEEFDHDLLGYDLRFRFNFEDIKATATVSSRVAEAVILDHGAFYLDIDVSSTYELPQKEDTVFSLLDVVRDKKNALFESFITDEARELFDAQ